MYLLGAAFGTSRVLATQSTQLEVTAGVGDTLSQWVLDGDNGRLLLDLLRDVVALDALVGLEALLRYHVVLLTDRIALIRVLLLAQFVV